MQALISNTLLKKLRANEKPFEVRDTRLKGFILRVQPTGTMSYIAEYARGKRITIGRADRITSAQARDKAREVLAGACLGQDPQKPKPDPYDLRTYLEEVYEPWMEAHYPKSGLSQTRRIESSFTDLLDVGLEVITPRMIQEYRSKRLKAGVSPKTVNRDVSALKAAVGRAFEWEIIEKHPLRKIKPLEEDKNEPVRYLTNDEETRLRKALDKREERIRQARDRANQWRRERGLELLKNLRSVTFADRLKPLFLLSLNTGIRRGEAFNLRWDDVGLDQANLTIRAAKTHLTRHIPLNSEASAVLKAWRKQNPKSDLVFPSHSGTRLDNIRRSWAGVLKGAKIKDFRWHDLRHTFASNLVMAGVDLNVVRELLGHTDIKMTLRYAHLRRSIKEEAVEKLIQTVDS